MQSINVVELYADPLERERLSKEIQVNGEIKEFAFKIKRKDNRIIDVISSTKARYDQDGNMIGYMSIIRDITEKQMAAEPDRSLGKVEATRQLLDDGIFRYELPDRAIFYLYIQVGRTHFILLELWLSTCHYYFRKY